MHGDDRAEADAESAEFALERLAALNDSFKQSEESETRSAAINYAQSLMGAVLGSQQSDALSEVAGLTMALVGHDLDLPVGGDEIDED